MTKIERAGAIVEAALNRPVGNALKTRLANAFGWRLPPNATMDDKADALIKTVVETLKARLDQYETAQAVELAVDGTTSQNAADMAESP